jgi:colicin import membrane protein
VATERGRKAIASMAYKVARTKTAIDEAGKKLNEEARARINAVDESRREIRKQLDDLKDEVRRPLTAWEEAEAAREVLAAETLAKIREKGRVELEDTVATVKARLDELSSLTINPEVHGDATGVAEAARTDAIAALQSAHDRLVREEAERAELEKLRAEAAERERKEQEAREAAEVERRRAESEAAEKVRLEAIARAAEERARIEAERVAKEEREAAERAHAEALAAERRRAEEAERAAQAERDAAARAEAERVAAAEREAAEQARRDADRAHRSKVMGAAKEAIMEAGEVDEAAAKRIVLAIAAGSVPAISIRF